MGPTYTPAGYHYYWSWMALTLQYIEGDNLYRQADDLGPLESDVDTVSLAGVGRSAGQRPGEPGHQRSEPDLSMLARIRATSAWNGPGHPGRSDQLSRQPGIRGDNAAAAKACSP